MPACHLILIASIEFCSINTVSTVSPRGHCSLSPRSTNSAQFRCNNVSLVHCRFSTVHTLVGRLAIENVRNYIVHWLNVLIVRCHSSFVCVQLHAHCGSSELKHALVHMLPPCPMLQDEWTLHWLVHSMLAAHLLSISVRAHNCFTSRSLAVMHIIRFWCLLSVFAICVCASRHYLPVTRLGLPGCTGRLPLRMALVNHGWERRSPDHRYNRG